MWENTNNGIEQSSDISISIVLKWQKSEGRAMKFEILLCMFREDFPFAPFPL